ncbi:hypothetical protein [Marinobacterium aestuariivivens]|uniref:Uncharacterized protein n=1 Tax=Marinobacterium aestuariivivens TaxID=1698799 RepID=A0ABW2A903_9GAMM
MLSSSLVVKKDEGCDQGTPTYSVWKGDRVVLANVPEEEARAYVEAEEIKERRIAREKFEAKFQRDDLDNGM